MRKSFATTLALGVLTIGAAAARSETLLIDGIDQETPSADSRPKAGQSMSAVESRFGTPAEKRGAVGQPPITRWDYADFSVYFEQDRVIHAVAHRR
jgi:hypothetical protein